MGTHNIFDNNQCPCGPINDPIVDKLLGNAYQVVKYVAMNMPAIKVVSDEIASILAVYAKLKELSDIQAKIPELMEVQAALPHLEVLHTNLVQLLTLYTHIDELVKVATGIDDIRVITPHLQELATVVANITEVVATGTNITKVIAVANSIVSVNKLAPVVAEIDTLAQNVQALVNINTHLPELLNINHHLPDLLNIETPLSKLVINSFEALRRTYAEAGLTLVAGSFEEGAKVTTKQDVVLERKTGKGYNWQGDIPSDGKIIPAGSTPNSSGGIGSGRWVDTSATTLREPIVSQTRELLRRSYAEAGYNLVAGSFESGGTLSGPNDVLLQEFSGRAYSGPTGVVAPGTSPSSEGFVDVSTKLNATVSTVADLKRLNAVALGMYRTKGYYAAGDGGGADYIAELPGGVVPDGYGDHIAESGVYLRLMSEPTDLRFGVKVSGTYVPADARHNRNALQSMIRDPRWSYTECVAQGTYYILGSVNVGRDNITWKIRSGCFIRGRYSDPSIPTPDQAGGMFNFIHYFDPDNGDFVPYRQGDTRVNPYIKNVHVIVDGDVSSEYNAAHINPYNNNCIGIAKAINCSITGKGGCSGSDHRGFLIEGIDTNAPGGSENRGGGINCHISVGYINNCVDNPAMIRGDIFTPSLQTIKVGSVGVMKSGGYNDPIVFNVDGPGDFEINLGSFIGDNVVKPALVSARDARSVKLKAGIVNGAKSCLFSYHTLDNDVEVDEVYNTPTILIRGGTEGGRCRTLRVHGLKATDSNLQSAISTQNNLSAFQRMEISNNSFSSVGPTFYIHAGRVAGALPVIEDIKDNFLPSTGELSGVLNRLSNMVSANLVPAETTSFSFNFKSPAFQYTKASVCIRNGGARGLAEIDLRGRQTTNNDIVYSAGDQRFNTSISGSTLTITTTSPAVINFIILHN